MPSSIVPLSTLPQSLLMDFLRGRGMSDEVVRWKYFDADFNRDRERGLVWMKDGRVEGFLGLIPWLLRCGRQVWDMAWTCDWMLANPQGSPGMGVALLKNALQSHDHVLSFGGNETTRKLLPRLASQTIENAGQVYWKPLRLGAVLKKGVSALHWPQWLDQRWLGQVPLGLMPRGRRGLPTVHSQAGLPPDLARLLERSSGTDAWQVHDSCADLDWMLCRCPNVVSESCFVAGADGPEAAAVMWHPRESTDFWRLVLWGNGASSEAWTALLRDVVCRVYDGGGLAVALIVAQQDQELVGKLTSNGFWKTKRHLPLYVSTQRASSQSVGQVGHLSYLSTDLAYRF